MKFLWSFLILFNYSINHSTGLLVLSLIYARLYQSITWLPHVTPDLQLAVTILYTALTIKY